MSEPTMTDRQARAMWWGLFIGDAMGVPLEFNAANRSTPVTTFTGGGVHKAQPGEYSDDGAMALCISDAYIRKRHYCASTIQRNFIDWKNNGTFGTRPGQSAWDIGLTISRSLAKVSDLERPYVGCTDEMSSGNGSIMRMAACIIWNRHNLGAAVGESVAQALLTHASPDTVTYTSALAHELWEGRPLPAYDHLRQREISNSGYVADTYASAWHSVLKSQSPQDAIVDAINRGGDADTVGAVTGMIAGRMHDGDWPPFHLAKQVVGHQMIASQLDLMLKLSPARQ